MKHYGWIDPNGKFHGVDYMGHIQFIADQGFGSEDYAREAGWIQCSGCDHVFSHRSWTPTQAQQDRVMRYLKRECMSKYHYDKCWQQFSEWYLRDYGGKSDEL